MQQQQIIGDIAFVAGVFFAKGEIPEADRPKIKTRIFDWATQFEEAYDADILGDDYEDLVDAYAEFRARGKDAEAERLIAMMRRLRSNRDLRMAA
ncbi:hypothetical protein [Azonexus hydrophilus]|uniref:Uncharacterized protein n=1 Tax=Azonexus hydrophilus TaxID=418702 RepID=A0ABZ2XQ56_9RHOO